MLPFQYVCYLVQLIFVGIEETIKKKLKLISISHKLIQALECAMVVQFRHSSPALLTALNTGVK